MPGRHFPLPIDERRAQPRRREGLRLLVPLITASAVVFPLVSVAWLTIHVRDLNTAIAVLAVADGSTFWARVLPLLLAGVLFLAVIAFLETLGERAWRNPGWLSTKKSKALGSAPRRGWERTLVILGGLVALGLLAWAVAVLGVATMQATLVALSCASFVVAILLAVGALERFGDERDPVVAWVLALFVGVAVGALLVGTLAYRGSPLPSATLGGDCTSEGLQVVAIDGRDAWILTTDTRQLEFREGIVPDLHFCRS